MALMATAFERFRVGAALALRTREREGKAQANLEALLLRARPYGVRGLAAFAADLDAAWERKERLAEGRCDERDGAVTIATVHAAKGLEWPIIIPVNGATRRTQWDSFVHRRSDGTLHWSGKGVVSPAYAAASEQERVAQDLEAERLWYVACTRARDFLVLPDLPHADKFAPGPGAAGRKHTLTPAHRETPWRSGDRHHAEGAQADNRDSSADAEGQLRAGAMGRGG